MSRLRRLHLLACLVLAWFVTSLGVAVASPVIQPKAMQLVCTTAGAVKIVVQSDDGVQVQESGHLDCPLCVLNGAPPPNPQAIALPQPLPLGRALQSIPAARLAAATAAPLPARGPPLQA